MITTVLEIAATSVQTTLCLIPIGTAYVRPTIVRTKTILVKPILMAMASVMHVTSIWMEMELLIRRTTVRTTLILTRRTMMVTTGAMFVIVRILFSDKLVRIVHKPNFE